MPVSVVRAYWKKGCFMTRRTAKTFERWESLITRARADRLLIIGSTELMREQFAKEREITLALADALEAARQSIELADLLADLCGGVTGADDSDTIGSIKAHFSNRPSMWLKDAMSEAVDAYRAARKAGGRG